MSDTKKLTQLGSAKTAYPTKPEDAVLETFINQHQDSLYLVPFTQERDEFTSLCPKTGQPDQAKMEIVYVPNKRMIESKSLKLYFFSFRNTGEFHEDVCNRIAKDLFKLMKPKYLRVFGDFSPRGGLAIKPMVSIWQKNLSLVQRDEILSLVNSFDIKK